MGIPSYFGYIIKKHRHIIKTYVDQRAHNLYMDCNSIVYDCVHEMESPTTAAIIEAVCARILAYIELVNPAFAMVAFDGVPPMAKMKQQRERRYKSECTGWNTVQITPGTTFMKHLDERVRQFFSRTKYHVLVSGSDVAGEGEHKIFEQIRSRSHKGESTFIYGLDSDLIMLALNHLDRCESSLLREAAKFTVEGCPREGLCLLDVRMLATEIGNIIGPTKLRDYILVTMLLGNDFMPRFPALNLRTDGMDYILHKYASVILPEEHIVSEGINWSVLFKFVRALSLDETRRFRNEHNRPRKAPPTEENLPMFRREMEMYINPNEAGWEHRYYKTLCQSEPTPLFLKMICQHYYRMLNWTVHYYTSGCIDWAAYYPYMYPPLLVHLNQHHFDMLTYTLGAPASPTELLAFVMPAKYAGFAEQPYVPTPHAPKLYWAYCKYTWEAHLLF